MNRNELAEVLRLYLVERGGSMVDYDLMADLEADGLDLSYNEMYEALGLLNVDWCDVGDEDRGPVDLVILRGAA